MHRRKQVWKTAQVGTVRTLGKSFSDTNRDSVVFPYGVMGRGEIYVHVARAVGKNYNRMLRGGILFSTAPEALLANRVTASPSRADKEIMLCCMIQIWSRLLKQPAYMPHAFKLPQMVGLACAQSSMPWPPPHAAALQENTRFY